LNQTANVEIPRVNKLVFIKVSKDKKKDDFVSVFDQNTFMYGMPAEPNFLKKKQLDW
jgi:hypothetical protein